MTTRQHMSHEQVPSARPPLEIEPPPSNAAREAADAFLRAADRALERALSTEPADFLERNRQRGGQ